VDVNEVGRGREGKMGRRNDEGKGAYRYFFFPSSTLVYTLSVLETRFLLKVNFNPSDATGWVAGRVSGLFQQYPKFHVPETHPNLK